MTTVIILLGNAPWTLTPYGVNDFRTESGGILSYDFISDKIIKTFPFIHDMTDQEKPMKITLDYEIGRLLRRSLPGKYIFIQVPNNMSFDPDSNIWKRISKGLDLIRKTESLWNCHVCFWDNNLSQDNQMLVDRTRSVSDNIFKPTESVTWNHFNSNFTESYIGDKHNQLEFNYRGGRYSDTDLINGLRPFMTSVLKITNIKTPSKTDTFLISWLGSIGVILLFLTLLIGVSVVKLTDHK